jgi:transcriptional regulator with XRE-family HTH domain
MNNIISDLNAYRLDNRLSQENLAKELKVAFCTVNRWFKGRNKPNMIQEHQIRKLLGYKVSGFKYQVSRKKKEG